MSRGFICGNADMTNPTNWPNPERPGVEITLLGGHKCIIDEDKYDLVSPYNWTAMKRGDHIYARAKVKDGGKHKVLLMHRLITSAPKGMVVDHINRNTSDNRMRNLRICTQQQNCMNRLANKNTPSGIKGISWDKERSKWYAVIKLNQKNIFLGRFEDFDKAKEARINAEIRLFGQYAPSEIRNLGAAP